MYYIINQTNQIIAIDDTLLELLQIKNIEEVVRKTILNKLQFTMPTEENVTITHKDNTYQFHAYIHALSSILGDFRLVHLQDIKVEEDEQNLIDIEEHTHSYDNLDDLLVKDNIQANSDSLSISPEIDIQKEETEDELFTLTLPNEANTTIDKITLDTEEISQEKILPKKETEDELFTLTLPNEADATIDEILLDTEEISQEEILPKESSTLDDTPIFIDIENISKTIGISEDDYKTFLNEYIDSAISLEEPLKSDDKEKRIAAIETLTQLADVLQLPRINEIISKIDTLSSDNRPQMITTFYTLLSRLTVHTEPQKIEKKEPVETFIKQEDTEKELSADSFGSIDLHDVKPIHFNFQISQAANDLSLPEELIEEFVHDFIEQAHEETKKMLKAYESGDLDTIQKIGHLLKGASSNLRIKELSDTLYAIQFCEKSSQLEDLFKEYWGHFLSLEKQINVISKKGNN